MKRGVWLAGLIFGCVVLLFSSMPKHRMERFVSRHGDRLAAAIETNDGIPANIGIRICNAWDGEDPMTEFILWTRGSTYYGCYYSENDMPCAFQNAEVPFVQQKDDLWTWQGEGDNHGSTWRIKPHWYGFEASF